MKPIVVIFSIAVISILFSCTTAPNHTAGSKFAIFSIDEKNETLYSLSLSDKSMTQIVSLGKTPNDLFIYSNQIFIVNSGFGGTPSIQVISNNRIVTNLPLAKGSNPYAILADSSAIYCTLSVSNTLKVFDRNTLQLVKTIALTGSFYPQWMAQDDENVYIACSGFLSWSVYTNSDIVVVSKSDLTIRKTVRVLDNTQSVSIDSFGNLYTASASGILRIAASTYQTNRIASGYEFFQIKYDNGRLYAYDSAYGISKSGMAVFSTNGAKLTNLFAGRDLKGLCFDATNVYVSGGYGATNLFIVRKDGFAVAATLSQAGGDMELFTE